MLRDVAARWNVLHGLTQSLRQTTALPSGAQFSKGPPQSVQPVLPQAALDGPSEFGARGELHLKRRSFARRRHHPDAPAVHLDDLLGDGEAEARAALGLGKRAVDLVELVEDPIL